MTELWESGDCDVEDNDGTDEEDDDDIERNIQM
jgi:hypothetical protein